MGAMSPATALLLSGIGGSVGSLGAGLLSSSSASSNNAKALDFNRWSQLQAQEFQRQMYNQQKMDQENFYTKFQTPEAVAKQLQKLGLNPANVLGQGNGLGGSPVSLPSGMSSPALSAPALENEGSSMAQAIQAIGSSVASIAQAGQTTEQSQEYLNTFNERVNSLILKNNEQELLNAKAQWDLYAAQEKLPYEIQEMVLNAYKLKYEGEYTQSLKALTDIQKYIEEHSKDFTIEQRNQMTTLLGRQIAIAVANENLLKEQKLTEKSKQAYNYASASEARENAKTIDAIRNDVVRYHQAIANIHDTKDFVTSNTAWNEVQQSLYELQAAKLVPDQVMQAIEHAKKENNWYEINELLGIVDTGVKAYGTYYGAKTGQGFVDSQNVRNRIDEDFKDWQKSHGDRKKVYNVETGDVYWSR